MFELDVSPTYFWDRESAGPSAVVCIERLWRQYPLAPADVSEVHPKVTPRTRPGLTPLSPPGLFHNPLIEAEHLWPSQSFAPFLTLLPEFCRCFGFRWEIRVLPQLVILQGVVMDLGNVIGLDLVKMKLPSDPWGCARLGCVLTDREGPVPLEGHGHAVGLIYCLIICVYQDVWQVGRR